MLENVVNSHYTKTAMWEIAVYFQDNRKSYRRWWKIMGGSDNFFGCRATVDVLRVPCKRKGGSMQVFVSSKNFADPGFDWLKTLRSVWTHPTPYNIVGWRWTNMLYSCSVGENAGFMLSLARDLSSHSTSYTLYSRYLLACQILEQLWFHAS